MNPNSPIQQNPSTQQQQQQQQQSTQPFTSLFDPQQLLQQQQQQLNPNPVNNISIPSSLTNISVAPPNEAINYNNNTPIQAFSNNMYNANMRNNNNNIDANSPHSVHSAHSGTNSQPQAAVLQEFANNKGTGGRICTSPNSSGNQNNKHPNFDYKALSRSLRDQYPKKMIIWSEMCQNETLFEQLDRPLVEALLLPKHRPQILEYEQKIIEFLVSDEWTYRFPANLSSFNRLLLHRLSETFKLDHHVEYVGHPNDIIKHNNRSQRDDQNKAVTIYKMENTRFADIQLSQIDVIKLTAFHVKRLTETEREEWEEKKSKYSMTFNQHMNNNNMNNINNNVNHNQNHNQNRFRYQKKLKQSNSNNNISPRDSMNNNNNNNVNDEVTDAQFDENEGQQQPVKMLIRKGIKDINNNNISDRRDNNNNKIYENNNGKKLKLEHKQEKYNKMKEKIFSGVSSPKSSENKNDNADAVEENKNDIEDEDEMKQSLVGSIAEHEVLNQQEGLPDQNNQKVNDNNNIKLPIKVENVKVNDDNEQKEGQPTQSIPFFAANSIENNSNNNSDNKSDPVVRKKFGIKKGGWAITKEKRTKDINHSELFKKSAERLQKLCQQRAKNAKSNHKKLRASSLQKTLEEKKRSTGVSAVTFTSTNVKSAVWEPDKIDGKHEKKHNSFATHSLIPNAQPTVATVTKTAQPTPPIVQQLTNNVNSVKVNSIQPTDRGAHDRGATPLLSNVADTSVRRNDPSVNVYKQGQTQQHIQEKLLLQGQVTQGQTVGQAQAFVPQNPLVTTNYNASSINRQIMQQLNPTVTQANAVNGVQQANIGTGVSINNITGNPYTLPVQQQVTNTVNPYSLPTQQIGANNTIQQQQQQFYAAAATQINNGILTLNNNNVTAGAVATATPQQPTNLYDLYRLQAQAQQQQQQDTNNMNNNVQQAVDNNNIDVTQQQLNAQKTQCLNAINQYNQLIHYFQNAGQLNAEQQAYLLSLQQNSAMQQQHLQRIQCAELLLQQQQQQQQQQQTKTAEFAQVEREKLVIAQQIEQHQNLQLQLVSAQQVTQNQSVQIAQNLQTHTLLYQQAQQSGNQNAMYVATLQMQQDQQLQQQNTNKLNAIVQQLIHVQHILSALQQQQKQLTNQQQQMAAQAQQTQGQVQVQTQQGQTQMNASGSNSTLHSSGENSNSNSQPQVQPQQQLYLNGQQNKQMNGQNANNNTSASMSNNSGTQQGQQRQMPNPTVNALVIHTGNGQGNVNINLYAGGGSGVNDNNQTNGNNNKKFNKNNRRNQWQPNMQSFNKNNNNKTTPAGDNNAVTNESDNETPKDGLQLTNASSNSSASSHTPNELRDVNSNGVNVSDVAMGPRHTRQVNGRQSPNGKFENENNSEENGSQNNTPNKGQVVKQQQQQGQEQQQQQQQQQQRTNQNQNQNQNQRQNSSNVVSIPGANNSNSNVNNNSNNNNSNNNNMRASFQSHHSNPTRGNNNNINRNNNNVPFERSNSNNNRNNNRNNNNNNYRNNNNHSRSHSWGQNDVKVTVWMADWFYNRDGDTQNTIKSLQKRLRLPNKKIKTLPNRKAPPPPDVFGNEKNYNRYRSNSGHRGRNYRNNRGRNNYNNNSRGYNSRRNDNYNNQNNNRFNNNNNNNNSNDNNNQTNINNRNNNNQSNNNMNNNNNNRSSGYSRNRRRYNNNKNTHFRHNNMNNNQNNNRNNNNQNNNQNNNNNSNSNNNNNNNNQSNQLNNILAQQNLQQMNRNSNNMSHRIQQSQQMQNNNNVSFANNLMNNNNNNVATNQNQ